MTFEMSDVEARVLVEHLAVTIGDEIPGSDEALLWALHDRLVEEMA